MSLKWTACPRRLLLRSLRVLDRLVYVPINTLIAARFLTSIGITGWQDNSNQVPGPSLHQADSQLTSRTIDDRYIQEKATHIHRMSVRLSRRDD